MRVRLPVVSFLVAMLLCSGVQAAEYFVNKQGSDVNNGASRDAAFLTIQKGVDALRPGDTLTIGPGEYFENVKILNFGDLVSQTVIHAEIPGTALLRGDRAAPAFSRIEGRRFAHVADFEGPAFGLHEMDTLHKLNLASGVDALDMRPGSYYFDEAAGKLYVSSSDFQTAEGRYYTVPVRKDHGFHLLNSQNILIEGMAATGFVEPVQNYVFLKLVSGFMLEDSRQITMRNCTAYLNQSGITLHNGDRAVGGGNVVEHSRSYGNRGDGIACYYPHDTIFRDNVTFLNGAFGTRFYAGRTGTVQFLRNLSWGSGAKDFEMKGLGEGPGTARAEYCVGLNDFAVSDFAHCILGGPHIYLDGNHARHDTPLPADTVRLPIIPYDMVGVSKDDTLDALAARSQFLEREFADAVNFDFRLQADSSLRNPVGDEPFRGLYPFEPNVHYLRPDGDDGADGLSMTRAWKTLDHAVGQLQPGDTLYLAEGRYALNVPVAVRDISLRGRGLALPTIEGQLAIVGVEGVTFERLSFTDLAGIRQSREVRIKNCVFTEAVEARSTDGLDLSHVVMAQPLILSDCSKVALRGVIFASTPAVAVDGEGSIFYSDYNSYADHAGCWKFGDRTYSLTDLRPRQDVASQVIVPVLGKEEGRVIVQNLSAFAGRGPLGANIGLYREWKPVTARVAGPEVRSVTDTTANIEWWINTPLHLELTAEDAEGNVSAVGLNQTDTYGTYSLIGLEPNREYTVRITPVHAHPQRRTDPAQRVQVAAGEPAANVFRTIAQAAEPHVYYVATDGNDDSDGLARPTAWQTLQHAANTVRPGDTVRIAGGEYRGVVYLPITGAKGRPITFTSIPGEKVVIVGGGFRLYGKHHYRFDALYFKDFDEPVIAIRDGSDLELTRIHRVSGWSPALQAYRTSDILVRNCVLLGGIGAVEATQCPNLRFENNVAYGNMISHIRIDNGPDEPFTLARNIFAETGRGKQHIPFLGVWQVRSMTETNNCLHLRWPESERAVFEIYELSQTERRIDPLFDVHTKGYFFDTLPAYRAVVGPTDMFVANPCWPGGRGFSQGWPSISAGDFPNLFTANPELILRGIGLQPEVFADFHFAKEQGGWPFDREWAETMLAAQREADALAADGKDAEALEAYLRAAEMQAPERIKSALLEAAAMCAERTGQIDRALQIADSMPEKFVALRNACRMRILLNAGRYAELIEAFSDKPGGTNPLQHWNYPELDDLLVDIYNMRATAYAELGELEAAEADLKVVIEAQTRIGLYSGAGIQDLAWLKLGNFYRDYLKDDDKALEAFLRVTDRTRPRTSGAVPVLNAIDGALAEAAESAARILRSRGRDVEASKVEFDALFAQGNAFGLLDRKTEAISCFQKALTIDGISDAQQKDCERRLAVLENGQGR